MVFRHTNTFDLTSFIEELSKCFTPTSPEPKPTTENKAPEPTSAPGCGQKEPDIEPKRSVDLDRWSIAETEEFVVFAIDTPGVTTEELTVRLQEDRLIVSSVETAPRDYQIVLPVLVKVKSHGHAATLDNGVCKVFLKKEPLVDIKIPFKTDPTVTVKTVKDTKPATKAVSKKAKTEKPVVEDTGASSLS